jgi:hypothetical protein
VDTEESSTRTDQQRERRWEGSSAAEMHRSAASDRSVQTGRTVDRARKLTRLVEALRTRDAHAARVRLR